MAWMGMVFRLVTGGVWIAAGLLKVPDPTESVRAVRAYRLLPESVVPVVGHGLPLLEILVGVCLVAGLLTRVAAGISALLFVAFLIGISSVWARGISIDCGCFGGGGAVDNAQAQYPWEIARDFGLLLLSAWLIYRPATRWAVDNALFRTGSSETRETHYA
jgi:uncharacterized membrane protein YphA (DoxX/SURF4 family)